MNAVESWKAPSTTVLDTGFLPSWFEYDPELDEGSADARTNWGAISGLALSIAFSATFWAGVVWAVERVRK